MRLHAPPPLLSLASAAVLPHAAAAAAVVRDCVLPGWCPAGARMVCLVRPNANPTKVHKPEDKHHITTHKLSTPPARPARRRPAAAAACSAPPIAPSRLHRSRSRLRRPAPCALKPAEKPKQGTKRAADGKKKAESSSEEESSDEEESSSEEVRAGAAASSAAAC